MLISKAENVSSVPGMVRRLAPTGLPAIPQVEHLVRQVLHISMLACEDIQQMLKLFVNEWVQNCRGDDKRFSLFWSGRRFKEGDAKVIPWHIGVYLDNLRSDVADIVTFAKLQSRSPSYACRDACDASYPYSDGANLRTMSTLTMNADDRGLDLREVVKNKADKHRRYYRKLCATYADDSVLESEMEQPTSPVEKYTTNVRFSSDDGILEDDESKGRSGNQLRQRRTGVFEMVHGTEDEESVFKSVKLMREKYQAMLERTSKNLQESQTEKKLNRSGSVDGLLAPPVSGYCSSTASTGSDDEREKNWPPKHAPVVRCSSSDSALGLTQSDDELTNVGARWTNSADISTSNFSPYSPRGSVDHVNVPTKTLIEAQCVQLPLDRKLSDCVSDSDLDKCDSRRQSCFTDDGEEQTRYRFWRTPSIVVSDYSDDVIGLTLDDIEFYRNQRKETSSSPDSSVHSSCSNLNYCGSTISSLDAEYIRRQPFRKSSDCSTCSTLSGDEDTEGSLQPPSSDKGKNVTDPTSGKQIPDATEGPKVHDHPPGDAPVAAKPDAKPPSKPAPKPAPKPSPKPDPKPEAPKPPAPAA